MQGLQIDNFPMEGVSIFLDADPDRRDEACSFGEIWVWISRKIKTKMFSLEISNYRDTDAREKNNDLLAEYSSTSAVFSIEFLIEEIELVVSQNQKFEYPAKSN